MGIVVSDFLIGCGVGAAVAWSVRIATDAFQHWARWR